jgi:hypothetical protein
LGAFGGLGGVGVTCSMVSETRQVNGGRSCRIAIAMMSRSERTKKRFQVMPTSQVA